MHVAIKQFKDTENDDYVSVSQFTGVQIQKTALREIQVLKHLKPHDHIVELHEVYKDDCGRIHLVFEQL